MIIEKKKNNKIRKEKKEKVRVVEVNLKYNS